MTANVIDIVRDEPEGGVTPAGLVLAHVVPTNTSAQEARVRVLLFVLTVWIVLSIPVAFVIGRVCGLSTKSSELLEPLIPSTRLPA